MGEWDGYLEEYITANVKGCSYAGLAMVDPTKGAEDTAACNVYAAAPQAGDAGWAGVFAAPQYRKMVTDEDGNETDVWIDELQTVIDCLQVNLKPGAGKTPPATGLWLGGVKFKIVATDWEYVVGEYTFRQMKATATKQEGESAPRVAYVVSLDKDFAGPTQVVFGVGMFRENDGNVGENVAKFAEYMKGQGY